MQVWGMNVIFIAAFLEHCYAVLLGIGRILYLYMVNHNDVEQVNTKCGFTQETMGVIVATLVIHSLYIESFRDSVIGSCWKVYFVCFDSIHSLCLASLKTFWSCLCSGHTD